jgi:hypothetical protein
MRTNDTQDELFDVLLKRAFLESSEKEIAEYEREAEKYAAVTPTAKQKKQARRAYRRANPGKSTAAGRIAASVVLALCLGAASILAVPSVRANLFDTFVKFYDDHVTFKRSEGVKLQGFHMYYVPEGYHLENAVEARPFCQYFFTNEEGERLILKYMLTSSSKVNVDNEHYDIEKKNLFGNVMGYTMVPRDPDISTSIMWENGEHTFMLDGYMPVRELVRIARCITPVEEAETPTP